MTTLSKDQRVKQVRIARDSDDVPALLEALRDPDAPACAEKNGACEESVALGVSPAAAIPERRSATRARRRPPAPGALADLLVASRSAPASASAATRGGAHKADVPDHAARRKWTTSCNTGCSSTIRRSKLVQTTFSASARDTPWAKSSPTARPGRSARRRPVRDAAVLLLPGS